MATGIISDGGTIEEMYVGRNEVVHLGGGEMKWYPIGATIFYEDTVASHITISEIQITLF